MAYCCWFSCWTCSSLKTFTCHVVTVNTLFRSGHHQNESLLHGAIKKEYIGSFSSVPDTRRDRVIVLLYNPLGFTVNHSLNI